MRILAATLKRQRRLTGSPIVPQPRRSRRRSANDRTVPLPAPAGQTPRYGASERVTRFRYIRVTIRSCRRHEGFTRTSRPTAILAGRDLPGGWHGPAPASRQPVPLAPAPLRIVGRAASDPGPARNDPFPGGRRPPRPVRPAPGGVGAGRGFLLRARPALAPPPHRVWRRLRLLLYRRLRSDRPARSGSARPPGSGESDLQRPASRDGEAPAKGGHHPLHPGARRHLRGRRVDSRAGALRPARHRLGQSHTEDR